MKNAKIFFLIFIHLTFIACSGLTTEKKIFWKYYLVATDTKESCALSYKLDNGSYVGISPDGVVAFAQTEKFIITKNLVNSKTEYYIFPKLKTDEYSFEKYLVGPLNEKDLKKFEKQYQWNLEFEKIN
jgi:hypothetical protein